MRTLCRQESSHRPRHAGPLRASLAPQILGTLLQLATSTAALTLAASGFAIAFTAHSIAEAPAMAPPSPEPHTTRQLIAQLNLEAHVEGGYFRRTYQADTQPQVATDGGPRHSMSSIFYLLTRASPKGHFHLNRSDIVHYFQLGDPIHYYLIDPDGELQTVVMGPDLAAGQQLQLTVPGGVWKASRLVLGEQGYGLISEAVTPGFDYRDMQLAERATLQAAFPIHSVLIEQLTRD